LPPHITLQQAKNFTETILRGDPSEGGILKQTLKSLTRA
jgi:pyruvate dehydrogenase (quinone)